MHELRAPFKDGTTHFVFDPLVFIERLAALVPPPRMHRLTYHGVLSSAASRRSEIVPGKTRLAVPDPDGLSTAPPTHRRPCSRYSWPELMARVFAVDVLRCAKCGSRRRWIAAITEASVMTRILTHLGLESTVPVPMPARPPMDCARETLDLLKNSGTRSAPRTPLHGLDSMISRVAYD